MFVARFDVFYLDTAADHLVGTGATPAEAVADLNRRWGTALTVKDCHVYKDDED